LKLRNINNIRQFLTLGLVPLVAFVLVGCFRPASNVANRADDQNWLQDQTASAGRLEGLDGKTEWSVQRYGGIVQKYSRQYNLDWRLAMAVMKHESRFNAGAVSHKGAFGLMQIMPATQAELAGKLGVNETETPSNNIKAGIYHLQQLYNSIDAADEENHIRLTLAAYNAGLNRVLDAQDVSAYLGDDPNLWTSVKSTLPLLTKRYESLHSNIWPSGRPRAGYFSDWRQTVGYVESVMSYYNHYQVALR
jgi:membrane-bound lytic murein transglycosylase F